MNLTKAFTAIIFFSLLVYPSTPASAELPYKTGETIHYIIKKLGMKLGEATLTYKGPATIYNQEALLMTFKAEALNFFDEEKIYMDPITMYPLIVQRDLNIWGKKEKIEEFYNQKNMLVKVVKRVGDKETVTMINKKGKIDNIYCFLYRYRRYGSFKEGEALELYLPTKDVSIALKELTEVEIEDKTYPAFYLKSDPRKYHLWFDTSLNRVPLRIDGALGIGKTKMVMREYQP